MSKQLKVHLWYNFWLSILASPAISATMLVKYGSFTWTQLGIDSLQSIVISFIVGAGFPFGWLTQPIKNQAGLGDGQRRLYLNMVICAVVSASVTAYFKIKIFGLSDQAVGYFMMDYPLSWLVAVAVAQVSEPYLMSLLKTHYVD